MARLALVAISIVTLMPGTVIGEEDQCLMRGCNSFAYPQYSHVDGSSGQPVAFDCSDAIKKCRSNNSKCRYSLVWTRYAGCVDGHVSNVDRFHLSSDGFMTIAGVQKRDGGVWGCELRAFHGNNLVATTITYRVFLLDVDDRGLTCGSQTCSKRSACYQILRTGSQKDAALVPPQHGCAHFDRIPRDVFNGLAGQPTKSCKTERASPQLCAWTGRYSSASNYVCCWCFSNACDSRSSIRQDTIELAFRSEDDSCVELSRLRSSGKSDGDAGGRRAEGSPGSIGSAGSLVGGFQTTNHATAPSRPNCVILLVNATLSFLSLLLSFGHASIRLHSHPM